MPAAVMIVQGDAKIRVAVSVLSRKPVRTASV
jgi:hypothetical protein